jgi:hypothetical protein
MGMTEIIEFLLTSDNTESRARLFADLLMKLLSKPNYSAEGGKKINILGNSRNDWSGWFISHRR